MLTKKSKIIGALSIVCASFVMNGCVPATYTQVGVGVNAPMSYAYPYYFDQPYYFYNGLYYYGGYYSNGYYYYQNRRLRSGHYYANGYRYYNGRRYQARVGQYGYYTSRAQYQNRRGVSEHRGRTYDRTPKYDRQGVRVNTQASTYASTNYTNNYQRRERGVRSAREHERTYDPYLGRGRVETNAYQNRSRGVESRTNLNSNIGLGRSHVNVGANSRLNLGL